MSLPLSMIIILWILRFSFGDLLGENLTDKQTGRMCGQRYNDARSTATDLIVRARRKVIWRSFACYSYCTNRTILDGCSFVSFHSSLLFRTRLLSTIVASNIQNLRLRSSILYARAKWEQRERANIGKRNARRRGKLFNESFMACVNIGWKA